MRIIALLLLFMLCCQSSVAQVFQPGFRTCGIWQEDPRLRLDIAIWYPASKQPKELNFPPWIINGAPNAKIASGKFPLIILSHASYADRFAYHATAAMLAAQGFVVAAPTHSLDCMTNMDDLFTWRQLAARAKKIRITIDILLDNKDIGPGIDSNRIGLIGYGSGASAALLLGGALPNCSSWSDYCVRAGASDSYCSPWARERIGALCQQLPLTQSLADTRIKAIAAIAPGFGMLFDSKSFEFFRPPLLLVTAGRDSFNRRWLHGAPIAKALGAKARLLDLPEADAAALISPCPQALAEELPELCLSLDPALKQAIQAKLSATLLAFFTHFLVIQSNLPVIAEPPNLEPEEPDTLEPQTRPVRKRRNQK